MLRQGALQSWQAWLISSFFLRIKIEWFVGISDEPLFVCVLLLDLVAMGSLCSSLVQMAIQRLLRELESR